VFELKKHLDESELSVFTGLVRPVSSLVVLGVELLEKEFWVVFLVYFWSKGEQDREDVGKLDGELLRLLEVEDKLSKAF